MGKVNRTLGLIKRSFSYMDIDLFLKLYKTLVTLILDYGNAVWYPYTQKNKKLIENTQRRATHLVPDLRGLSYTDRLKKLKHYSLEYRRKRGDMTQLFKILKEFEDISVVGMFQFSTTRTMGHNLKLYKPIRVFDRMHSLSGYRNGNIEVRDQYFTSPGWW